MRFFAVAGLAVSMLTAFGCGDGTGGPITWKVKRGQFVQEVRANGRLVCVGGVEIRCEVENPSSGGTRILWMAPEGTDVEPATDWESGWDAAAEDPPDLLVKLDSSGFEERRNRQQIACNGSEAELTEAESRYEAATVALEGFAELSVEVDRKALEAEIARLEAESFEAKDKLERGRLDLDHGIINEKELEFLEFQYEAIQRQLKVPKTLLANFEKRAGGKTGRLKLELTAAKARLDAQQRNHRLNLDRLAEVEAQIEACSIRAPASGRILYAAIGDKETGLETTLEEGMLAFPGQTLMRLWNNEEIAMKARIPEALISTVEVGLQATVRVDAFPDLELSGVVGGVSRYPVSRPRSATVEYEATIRPTEETTLPVRPGLSGEATIVIQRLPSVLTVPNDSILRRDGKIYCLLYRDRKWEARPVEIATGDDSACVVVSGLAEGDEVVRNAEKYAQRAGLR